MSQYYTYIQVSFCLKAGFFSGLKTRRNNSAQTLSQAFRPVFPAISQLKKTVVGLVGYWKVRNLLL